MDSPRCPGEASLNVWWWILPAAQGKASLNVWWWILPAVQGKRHSTPDGGFSPLSRGKQTLNDVGFSPLSRGSETQCLMLDSPRCPGESVTQRLMVDSTRCPRESKHSMMLDSPCCPGERTHFVSSRRAQTDIIRDWNFETIWDARTFFGAYILFFCLACAERGIWWKNFVFLFTKIFGGT